MSRCFPFPPPGYEKKPKLGDPEISAKKEKHKEKKEKKEKDKEKKDKERKDKVKDKHKKRDHDDKRKKKENSKDSGNDGVMEQSLEDKKVIEKEKLQANTSKENKIADREKASFYEQKISERGSHRLKDIDEKGREKDMLKDKIMEKLRLGDKEKIKGKGNLEARIEPWHTFLKQDREESKVVNREKCNDREREDKMKEKLVKDKGEKKRQDKEKIKREGEQEKYGDRDREKDKLKKDRVKEKDNDRDRGKDKAQEKEKHREEKDEGKAKSLDIEIQHLKNKHSEKASKSVTSSHMTREKINTSVEKKRKEIDSNGDFHDIDKKSSKHSRSTQGGLPVIENGRIGQETKDHSIPFAPKNGDGEIFSTRIESPSGETCMVFSSSRVQERNGKFDSQLPSVSVKQSSPRQLEAVNDSPLRDRPDHNWQDPQCLLNFPVKEPWSDFDDQSWILERSNLRPKPNVAMDIDKPVTRVWSKALHIKSVDIHALPFIIPY